MENTKNKPGKKFPIKYIGWGIADFAEGTIYLHEKLKHIEWRSLRKKLLMHEEGHLEGQYGFQDMINDLKWGKFDLDVLLFISQTPTSLVQFSPLRFYPDKRKLYIDPHLLLLYGSILFFTALAWVII